MDNEKKDSKTTSEEYDVEYTYKNFGEYFLPFLRTLWSVRKKILYINGSVFIIAIIYLIFFVNPYFESTVTILPNYGASSPNLGALGGLASIAGVSLGEGGTSNDVYVNLLQSEWVIEQVVNSKYKTTQFTDSVDLFQYFDVQENKALPVSVRRRKMFLDIYQLMIKPSFLSKSIITTKIDQTSNILDVTVRIPESELSASVANKLIESLDTYIRLKRKSNASIQRTYIEERISDVKDSLDDAENKLMIFQLNNKSYNQSPSLVLEQSRLGRKVQILQTVFVQLTSQLEIAKIEEIKDAPLLNVREWAQDPVLKAGPKRLNMLILILLVSVFSSLSYFLFFDKVMNYIKSFITLGSIK